MNLGGATFAGYLACTVLSLFGVFLAGLAFGRNQPGMFVLGLACSLALLIAGHSLLLRSVQTRQGEL